jgi:glycosyltransferase involved in cell wall biosynthesis
VARLAQAARSTVRDVTPRDRPAPRIAVVIPCYRVSRSVLAVIGGIGPEVAAIYAVDDACPERSGALVARDCADARVTVISHESNQGVGGAMVTGYRAALAGGAQIVVKVDGDGQMDTAAIGELVRPVTDGLADYTKGNRFHEIEYLRTMPRLRLFGNSFLSLVAKFASGYWNVMDPTNGFTAIHRKALEMLPLDKLDHGYFFESDMLFRLYTIRAVVRDVPLPARYGDEQSSLSIGRASAAFPGKYVAAAVKRIFYSYFLRDFNAGTLQLCFGLLIAGIGTVLGVSEWMRSSATGTPTTAGGVMLAGLPVLIGAQLLLGALNFDIQNVPREPLDRGDAGPAAAQEG